MMLRLRDWTIRVYNYRRHLNQVALLAVYHFSNIFFNPSRLKYFVVLPRPVASLEIVTWIPNIISV
jgi:hypothetical protein